MLSRTRGFETAPHFQVKSLSALGGCYKRYRSLSLPVAKRLLSAVWARCLHGRRGQQISSCRHSCFTEPRKKQARLKEMFAVISHHTRGHPAAFQRKGLGKAPEGNGFEAMRKNHENISCQGSEQMTRATMSTCEHMTESTSYGQLVVPLLSWTMSGRASAGSSL